MAAEGDSPMSGTKPPELINDLTLLFRSLLEEADPNKVPSEGEVKIGFADRLKLLQAGASLAALIHKVDPEESTDEFGRLSNRFHGRKGGRGAVGPAKPNGGSAPGGWGGPSPVAVPAAPAGGGGDAEASPDHDPAE